MWETYYLDEIAHIVPVNDLLIHSIDMGCYCRPILLYPDNIYKHNSYDKREYFEAKPRKKEIVN